MVHRKRGQKDTALYVGSDCFGQSGLGSHLQSIGIDLHKASSTSFAKQKLCEQRYDLLLLQFEHIRGHIFDFCRFAHHKHYETVILVMMTKAMPIIESRLFGCGVDDIVAGKQTLAVALKPRIKRRLAGRLSLPKTNKIMLKGGTVVDLERREVSLNGLHCRLNDVSHKLLLYFLENAHRAVSRNELIKSHIWDNSVCRPDKTEGGRAVDMAVLRLRRLIEPAPSNPQAIITVYGTGWILAKDALI